VRREATQTPAPDGERQTGKTQYERPSGPRTNGTRPSFNLGLWSSVSARTESVERWADASLSPPHRPGSKSSDSDTPFPPYSVTILWVGDGFLPARTLPLASPRV